MFMLLVIIMRSCCCSGVSEPPYSRVGHCLTNSVSFERRIHVVEALIVDWRVGACIAFKMCSNVHL